MANRTTFLTGPVQITHRSLTHYSDDGQPATLTLETADFDVGADGLGILDKRPNDCVARLSFTPDGRITPATAANGFYYPFSLSHGASVFTSTDLPAVILPWNNQKKWTLAAAAVTKPPTITLRAGAKMFGAVEITGLIGTAGSWGSAVAAASNTGVASHSFSAADIVSRSWLLNWDPDAETPILEDVDSVNGWTIEPTLQLKQIQTDAKGTMDYRITGQGMRLTGQALLTQQQLETIAGTGDGILSSGRGAGREDFLLRLVCEDGVNLIEFPKAVVSVGAEMEFGSTATHVCRKITFDSVRSFSAGVALPLIAFDTV